MKEYVKFEVDACTFAVTSRVLTFVADFAFEWSFAGVLSHMFHQSRHILITISAHGTQMRVNVATGTVHPHVISVHGHILFSSNACLKRVAIMDTHLIWFFVLYRRLQMSHENFLTFECTKWC